MSHTHITRLPSGPGISLASSGLRDRWIRFSETIDTWNRRHRTRQQFAKVESRVLRDIGVSEADRFIEVNKPFWEA